MMTKNEYRLFCEELKKECDETCFDHLMNELLEDVRQRDAELAKLIITAAQAEIAIAAYLRERDGN